MKQFLVQKTSLARQQSTKIIVRAADIFRFQLHSFDVTQAYLQGSENLMGDVHLHPPKEMNLRQNQLTLLLKPWWYGLSETGVY